MTLVQKRSTTDRAETATTTSGERCKCVHAPREPPCVFSPSNCVLTFGSCCGVRCLSPSADLCVSRHTRGPVRLTCFGRFPLFWHFPCRGTDSTTLPRSCFPPLHLLHKAQNYPHIVECLGNPGSLLACRGKFSFLAPSTHNNVFTCCPALRCTGGVRLQQQRDCLEALLRCGVRNSPDPRPAAGFRSPVRARCCGRRRVDLVGLRKPSFSRRCGLQVGGTCCPYFPLLR